MELDTAHMAPEITGLLLLRGMGLPAIQWVGFSNHTAKSKLSEIENVRLFKPHELKDDTAAAAVRALLALWHSLADEAITYTSMAAEKEQLYIAALAHRHMGQPHESKSFFQELQGHPIFDELAKYTVNQIGLGVDPSVKRLADLIKMDEKWEPFAFADIYEQARDGQFSQANEEIVQKIQFQEFCLLMRHCYLAATGLDVGLVERKNEIDPAEAARRRRQATVRRPKRHVEHIRTQTTEPTTKPDKPVEKEPSGSFGVLCPKCKKRHEVSTSVRGEMFKCSKCGSSFKIPGGDKSSDSDASQAAHSVILTLCPNCKVKLKFASNARGSKVMCSRCRTVFQLTDRNSSAA